MTAQRPLEFRVWSKLTKKFILTECYLKTNPTPRDSTSVACYIEHNNSWLFVHYANLIVMQFTGLLDKNGNKIFEGDILHGDREPVKFKEIEIENPYGELIYAAWNINVHDAKESVVIGNIYENPELLNNQS